MDTIIHDLRYAVRTLRNTPAFALAAVASLALGIGANAAVFTLLDRALLRPLPVEAPDELVVLSTVRDGGRRSMNFSYFGFRELQERSRGFAGMLAISPYAFTLTVHGAAERVDGTMVSADYFEVLGVEAARGRTFLADEEETPVVVLSDGLWRSRFGADPAVVGRTLTLDGKPFTVIGIAPAGFHGVYRGGSPDLWIPLAAAPPPFMPTEWRSIPNLQWLYLMGRLAPGVTREQAQPSLSAAFEQLEAEIASGEPGIIVAGPGARGFTAVLDPYERPLALLMGAVALVLLIACANVANLLLARASVRRRELAVRLSLGAGRARLLRQLLTESFVLALLGAAAGLVLAFWTADLLLGFRPITGEALAFDAMPDARVLGFTLAVSILAVIASGLGPALRASRPDFLPALKDEGAVLGIGGRRFGLRGALVVVQVALALVLLSGAGLLARSLGNLHAVDLGFDARNLLIASLDLGVGYDDAAAGAFQTELIRRVEALPGVRSASFATTVTPSPAGSNRSGLRLDGYEPAPDESIALDYNRVGPGYFETIGMRIVRGRGIDERDRDGSPLVAVISETVARRYWPDGDALGRRIFMGSRPDAPAATVVGIARAGKYRGIREEGGMMLYLAALQDARPWAMFVVRTVGDARAVVAPLRREVHALDPAVPLYDVTTMRDHLRRMLSLDRMVAFLSTLFGLLALGLAAVGIYGVMAYFAAQRSREIGIRIALGARGGDVLRLILRRGAVPVALGLAAGTAASLGLTQVIASLLYDVSPTDAPIFASVLLLLSGVAFLAAYLPARRAARVDPSIALQQN